MKKIGYLVKLTTTKMKKNIILKNIILNGTERYKHCQVDYIIYLIRENQIILLQIELSYRKINRQIQYFEFMDREAYYSIKFE
jgi:hypothetical protein